MESSKEVERELEAQVLSASAEILLIGDDSAQTSWLKHLIDTRGYSARVCSDGLDALESARAQRPTLIIASLAMPIMDGYELCHAIRADGDLKDIPVLLLLTLSDPEDALRGLKAMADYYLPNTFDHEEFISNLDSILFEIAGEKPEIRSRARHVLSQFLSGYENLVQRNRELIQTQRELEALNRLLEDKLKERTQEQQLAEANYRAVLERNEDPIIIVDRRGVAWFANTAAREFLSPGKEGIVGQPFLYPIEVGPARQTDMARADGQTVVVRMRVIETLWEGDIGYLIQLREIAADRRAAQTQEDIIEIGKELVTNVSKQLWSPLYSLKSFLDVLKKGRIKDPDVEQEFLARASQDASRVIALVDDMIDISRLETGKLVLEWEDVDLSELVEETVESLEPLAEEKDIGITSALPGSSMTTKADRRRMRQVLVNLIGNAVKFSGPSQPVHITGQIVGSFIRIEVSDKGPGISAEDLPHIFDKFYQADTGGKSIGAGLGLYISKHIIEAHGGQVGVDSQASGGSHFFFTLPLSPSVDESL